MKAAPGGLALSTETPDRRDVELSIIVPLYDEQDNVQQHRFVPVYAAWRGARVTEPVTHHPRARGRSKYGLERVAKVLLDLIVVKFLFSYLTKPIYVSGGLGHWKRH